MKIFIDSADLDEIKQFYEWGIADGVTTNPSLIKKAVEKLKKAGREVSMENYIKEILSTAKGTPVSLEVIGTGYEDTVDEGKSIYNKFNEVANNVVIKIPVNTAFGENDDYFEGIRAIKELSKENIPVNCTLIFTPEQALMAAKVGARYVSPFAGRVDDYLRKDGKFKKEDYFPAQGNGNDDNGILSGIDLVKKIVEIFRQHNLEAKVLAASIRNARQAREAALAGADIATLPYGVIKEMMGHYKTMEGMKKFTEDVVPEYKGIIK